MTRTRYIAMDIGCLECSLTSRLLGVYDDEASAKQACAEAETQRGYPTSQHAYEVFPFEEAMPS